MLKLLALTVLILSAVPAFADDFIIDEPGGSSSPQPRPALPAPSYGMNRPVSIGSVPTPNSPARGRFYGDTVLYETGGVHLRMVVGIFDVLGIGITENVDGLIGSGDVYLNIPGAYVKLQAIRNWNNFNLSLGFDSFAFGNGGSLVVSNTDSSRPYTIYGFYAVGGWPYSAFGGPDEFSFGFRIPLLPNEFRDIANTSLFFGATLMIPRYIGLGFTLENIYLTMDRPDRILPSVIVTFMPAPQFKASLILQYDFFLNRLNRILSVGTEAMF